LKETVPILLVDDDTDFTSAMQSMLKAEGFTVETAASAAEAKSLLARNAYELLFVDLSLPDGSGLELIREKGPKTVIITGHPSIKSAVRAVRGPVVDYLVKPLDKSQLLASIAAAMNGAGKSAGRKNVEGDNQIIGESEAMQKLMAMIADYAPTDEPVLILGESGTGKDLIARRIHEIRDAEGPFVAVNCGAIPRELIASELFGHEKGSFTGATGSRKGVFQRAQEGTVFLDEVGELPLDHQVALLRILENRTVTPVGGEAEIPIRARVIAATNTNLEQQVREGDFREDLFFRLMVLPIQVPPLRERKGDVEVLAQHFLGEYAKAHDAPDQLKGDVIQALNRYHWPGNVRELKHTILRMAILNRGKEAIDKLPESFDRPINLNADDAQFRPGMSIREVEKSLIEKTLKHFDGNKTQTAEALGISLKTLYNRLTEYEEQDES
jgi:DNA-binding NtrC family response regulator